MVGNYAFCRKIKFEKNRSIHVCDDSGNNNEKNIVIGIWAESDSYGLGRSNPRPRKLIKNIYQKSKIFVQNNRISEK